MLTLLRDSLNCHLIYLLPFIYTDYFAPLAIAKHSVPGVVVVVVAGGARGDTPRKSCYRMEIARFYYHRRLYTLKGTVPTTYLYYCSIYLMGAPHDRRRRRRRRGTCRNPTLVIGAFVFCNTLQLKSEPNHKSIDRSSSLETYKARADT